MNTRRVRRELFHYSVRAVVSEYFSCNQMSWLRRSGDAWPEPALLQGMSAVDERDFRGGQILGCRSFGSRSGWPGAAGRRAARSGTLTRALDFHIGRITLWAVSGV